MDINIISGYVIIHNWPYAHGVIGNCTTARSELEAVYKSESFKSLPILATFNNYQLENGLGMVVKEFGFEVLYEGSEIITFIHLPTKNPISNLCGKVTEEFIVPDPIFGKDSPLKNLKVIKWDKENNCPAPPESNSDSYLSLALEGYSNSNAEIIRTCSGELNLISPMGSLRLVDMNVLFERASFKISQKTGTALTADGFALSSKLQTLSEKKESKSVTVYVCRYRSFVYLYHTKTDIVKVAGLELLGKITLPGEIVRCREIGHPVRFRHPLFETSLNLAVTITSSDAAVRILNREFPIERIK